jgi:hypothetical protein
VSHHFGRFPPRDGGKGHRELPRLERGQRDGERYDAVGAIGGSQKIGAATDDAVGGWRADRRPGSDVVVVTN